MAMTTRKRPNPDLAIRLVGAGLRPWAVPMRTLTRTLQAVQSLIEKTYEEWEELDPVQDSPEGSQPLSLAGDMVSLYLLSVVAGSATYRLSTGDRERAIRALQEAECAIANPDDTSWPSEMLYPIRSLSEVAKSLGCVIEFRHPSIGRKLGDVIATIKPSTYDDVSGSAFVSGKTSVCGKVERVGGATATQCGIRVPNQSNKMVICSLANHELARQLGRHLYEYVVVSGMATWFRRDWNLKRMDIDAFEPPKTGSIIDTLDRAHDAGGYAWDNIEDPRAFLAEMRD